MQAFYLVFHKSTQTNIIQIGFSSDFIIVQKSCMQSWSDWRPWLNTD